MIEIRIAHRCGYNNRMPKTYTQYVCQQCGRVVARQMGRCPQCGAYNSLVEEVVAPPPPAAKGRPRGLGGASTPRRLTEIDSLTEKRLPLSIGEFARVLGGGIVPGSIVLIAGDPGIGKSTLLLQVALEMAQSSTVLYISGEESERQLKMRAERLSPPFPIPFPLEGEGDNVGKFDILGSKAAQNIQIAGLHPPSRSVSGGEKGRRGDERSNLFLVTETNLSFMLEQIDAFKPALVVVDSIQTTYMPEMESSAGSVSQVRECSSRLRELAKTSGVAVFLIGHVTKEGSIAGPRILEHIVDTVLYLEGDRFQSYRLLRGVKNRFGATSEVGVFEMSESGMVEVPNPSEAFLAERMVNAPGSAIAVTMEGTRPLLVEVQGLTSPTAFGNPRRTSNGVDMNRLLLTVAVLTRRVGVRLGEQDVFANVVGGIQVEEPAADLAMAVALASSYRDTPVRADTVLIGEVGLSGELRMVGQMPARLREAAKLGFKTAIVPKRLHRGEAWPKDISVVETRSLREAMERAMVGGGGQVDR
jgi:DNA repair protein RadA/Sms